MTALEQLTKHLGFDPTKEPGTLKCFEHEGDRPSRVFPGVRIKELEIIDLDSEWFKILLEAPNHRVYLEIDLEIGYLFANFPDGSDCPATLTFPSGILGASQCQPSETLSS